MNQGREGSQYGVLYQVIYYSQQLELNLPGEGTLGALWTIAQFPSRSNSGTCLPIPIHLWLSAALGGINSLVLSAYLLTYWVDSHRLPPKKKKAFRQRVIGPTSIFIPSSVIKSLVSHWIVFSESGAHCWSGCAWRFGSHIAHTKDELGQFLGNFVWETWSNVGN